MVCRFVGDGRLSARTVKFVVDGTPSKYALMHDAYNDGTFDVGNYTQERLFKIFDELTELGFRLYVHAEGDHGISRTISAFEYANQTGRPLGKDDRHAIAHLDHVRSVDYPRRSLDRGCGSRYHRTRATLGRIRLARSALPCPKRYWRNRISVTKTDGLDTVLLRE